MNLLPATQRAVDNGRLIDRDHAENMLGGPLSALRHLVGLLASDPRNPPLAAGEGWSAAPAGIALDEIRLRFG